MWLKGISGDRKQVYYKSWPKGFGRRGGGGGEVYIYGMTKCEDDDYISGKIFLNL